MEIKVRFITQSNIKKIMGLLYYAKGISFQCDKITETINDNNGVNQWTFHVKCQTDSFIIILNKTEWI